jgi:hypothetical protein
MGRDGNSEEQNNSINFRKNNNMPPKINSGKLFLWIVSRPTG